MWRSLPIWLLSVVAMFATEMTTFNLPCAANARAQVATTLINAKARGLDVTAPVAANITKWSLVDLNGSTFGFLASSDGNNYCSITSGAAVLTSPNSCWTSADVGKTIHVQGAGAGGVTLVATISGYSAAGSVTLSTVAETTVTASKTSTAGIAIWGYPATTVSEISPLTNVAGTLAYTRAPASTTHGYEVSNYGAVGDGVTNDTAAIQAAIDAAYAGGGGDVILGEGSFAVTTLVKNWASSPVSVNIKGAGKYATRIVKIDASTTPILDLTGTAPVQEPHFVIENLSVIGLAKGSPGIRVTRLARFVLSNVAVKTCSVALDNVGSLIFQGYDVTLNSNDTGYRCRKSGAIYANLVQFFGGEMRGNTTLACDIGEASGVHLYGVDIETNGTTGVVTTGGVCIRSTCDDETGFAQVSLNGVWLEANLGTSLLVEACAGLAFSSRDTHIASSEAGRAMTCGAIMSSYILNPVSGSAGDTYTIAAVNSVIVGGVIATITDTSTTKSHSGVTTTLGQTGLYANTLKPDLISMAATSTIASVGGYVDNARLVRFTDGQAAGNYVQINQTNGVGGNAAACTLFLGSSGTTGRSINAGGTVNVLGADFAEYEKKSKECGKIVPGDVIGFDANGEVTDKFSLSLSFGIVSTKPGFVGGDSFKDGEAVVVAYCGKVPCNIKNAKPGSFISVVKDKGDKIKVVNDKVDGFTIGRVRMVNDKGHAVVAVGSP